MAVPYAAEVQSETSPRYHPLTHRPVPPACGPHGEAAATLLTTTSTRVVAPDELDDALAVLRREPVNNAFVTARVQASGLDPWRLGGEMWGWYHRGRLESLCYAGANLVPLCAGPEAVRAFAERARRQGRRCSSVVGPAGPTAALWSYLEPHWGPAREVRSHQPQIGRAHV